MIKRLSYKYLKFLKLKFQIFVMVIMKMFIFKNIKKNVTLYLSANTKLFSFSVVGNILLIRQLQYLNLSFSKRIIVSTTLYAIELKIFIKNGQ